MKSQENINNMSNLTEADKIFIPSDIEGERSDYTEYKVGMFRTVPANCCLVRVNMLTGKIFNEGGQGPKFMLPFISKSILVPMIDRTIDYKKIEYLTNDNIMANVDIALNVRITNPVKYMVKGKYQLDQLSTLTHSLLRRYIHSLDFENISKGMCSLSTFAPNSYSSQNGKMLPNELDVFEEEYGIKVNRVFLKEVRLPKNLEKLYNDKVEEEKKKEAQRVRLEAEKEKAEMNANILDIQAEAEAKKIQKIENMNAKVYLDRVKKLVTELKDQGVSVEEISDLLKMLSASENENSRIIIGGTQQSRDIAMGMAAGSDNVQNTNQGSKNNNPTIHLNNSDRLLNHLTVAENFGSIFPGTRDKIEVILKNPGARESLDKLNEEDYKMFVQDMLNKYRMQDNDLANGRTR